MHLHTATWGHVALACPATRAMESAEEEGEMAMLRCRYGKKASRARASLCGFAPDTSAVIFNPNTLQDLAIIFEINIDRVFASKRRLD
jgi:hypothetical protein